jgi:hypothetical protein
MKNAENNEIDLLLRSLAQREGAGSDLSWLEERDKLGDHLDADELSSFAEGVVPAAARASYAAHLADCSRCRRIVAQLAVASGIGIRIVSTETWKSKLSNFIASFFTPAVMRYAVPAMSLIILAAIGLIWLQQTRRQDFVAQVNQPASEPATAQFGNQEGFHADDQARQGTLERSREPKTETTKAREAATGEEKSPAKNKAVVTDSIEREQQPAEPKTDVKDVAAAPPPSVARRDEDTAFSPKPAKEIAEENKRQELAKQRQAPAVPTAVQSEDERRNQQDKDNSAGNKKAETRSSSEVRAGTGGRAMGTQSAQLTTRTVAGRHFRRVNNTWVDTAYDSALHTTTLSRGSEQYRALVGDEPGLRTIAEQLDGEVIVVWKGRAYKIR